MNVGTIALAKMLSTRNNQLRRPFLSTIWVITCKN